MSLEISAGNLNLLWRDKVSRWKQVNQTTFEMISFHDM